MKAISVLFAVMFVVSASSAEPLKVTQEQAAFMAKRATLMAKADQAQVEVGKWLQLANRYQAQSDQEEKKSKQILAELAQITDEDVKKKKVAEADVSIALWKADDEKIREIVEMVAEKMKILTLREKILKEETRLQTAVTVKTLEDAIQVETSALEKETDTDRKELRKSLIDEYQSKVKKLKVQEQEPQPEPQDLLRLIPKKAA